MANDVLMPKMGESITEGRILGLGSLVHPRLTGQPPVDSFATEILLTEGRLTNGGARIAVEIVTLAGTIHQGWLEPGAKGICITAELLLIADPPPAPHLA